MANDGGQETSIKENKRLRFPDEKGISRAGLQGCGDGEQFFFTRLIRGKDYFETQDLDSQSSMPILHTLRFMRNYCSSNNFFLI